MDVRNTPTASIAVVTEDDALARSITEMLRDETTQVVQHPAHAVASRDTFKTERPDIVVLDRGTIPDVGGQIRHLRRRWPTIEVVVVNIRDDADAECMLDDGADDAIVSGSPLLAARLHARARHARTVNAGARIAVGDVVFERETQRVWCAGEEVVMTPREVAVLDCLFWHAQRPVSVTTLADFVWGDADATDRRGAVEVYIGYIRRKLAASRSVVIRTIRHAGYQFDLRQ
jgi:DNA-binding response OmpR family regulator